MAQMIYHDLTQAMCGGVTVFCSGLAARYNPPAELVCFVGGFGPTGTLGDGLAEGMIRMAEESGALSKGQELIEVGSGSFCAALTLAGYRTGHKVSLCVPATIPDLRKRQLTALGARLVFCNGFDGRIACVNKAKAMAAAHGSYYMDWCANELNPEYHRRITGPALYKALNGRCDFLVCGVGSGGTLTGCAEYMKAFNSDMQVIAVEPAESPVLSGGPARAHAMDGIGFGFVPEVYNPYIVDRILPVNTGDGKKFAGEALLCDGIPASPAAGAVIGAGLEIAMNPENAGKRVVAIVGSLVKY